MVKHAISWISALQMTWELSSDSPEDEVASDCIAGGIRNSAQGAGWNVFYTNKG